MLVKLLIQAFSRYNRMVIYFNVFNNKSIKYQEFDRLNFIS